MYKQFFNPKFWIKVIPMAACFFFAVAMLTLYGSQYQKNVLRIADFTSPEPINPLLTSSTISANLLDLLYDPLVEYTVNEQIKPALAEKWIVSSDGLEWIFELSQDVIFHDGSILTAEDVKATYEAVLAMKSSFYSYGLSNIESIEVPSTNILKMKMKKYDSFLPFFLRHIFISSRHAIREGIQNIPVVGTGAFTLTKFSSDEIDLSAFDQYFRGRPFLDEIIVKIFPNQRSCLTNLIADQADLVFLEDAINFDIFSNVSDYNVENCIEGLSYWLVFNLRNPEFKSDKTRRALNYAIDKSRIKKFAGERESGVLSCGDANYINMINYPYDPQKAIDLLHSDNWKNEKGEFFHNDHGKILTLVVAIAESNDVIKRLFRLVQDDLEAINIKVDVKVFPSFESLAKVLSKQDYDAFLVPNNIRAGLPMQYLFWHSKSPGNFSGYRNAEVDRLLDEIRYDPDPAKRKEAEAALPQALRDDPPGIPLFVKRTPVLVNSRFTGFASDPFEFFSSLRNVKYVGGKK